MSEQYAELIMPFRLEKRYTYRVPAPLQGQIAAGIRVRVQLGPRMVIGWVWNAAAAPPARGALRDILAVIDTAPLLREKVRRFYAWAAKYYMVSLGEVLQSAVPTSLHRTALEPPSAKGKASSELPAAFEGAKSLPFCPIPQLQAGKTKAPVLCIGSIDADFHRWATWIKAELQAGQRILWLLPTLEALKMRAEALLPYVGKAPSFYGTLSPKAQMKSWLSVAKDEQPLVLALQKGSLLPYPRLDLILIEEDQQEQFKEQYRRFRYHGRDLALMCGRTYGAQVLLFSKAPALESLHKAWQGRYLWHKLPVPRDLPQIELLAVTRKRTLQDHLQRALEEGQQVLLFHPHKGYGGYLQCRDCTEVPRCSRCGLVYRARKDSMYCSTCGEQVPLNHACKACGQSSWHIRGEGTEELTERLQLSFPELRIGRWEENSPSAKALSTLREAFYSKKTQVLIATAHFLYGWKKKWKGIVLLWGCEGWLYTPYYRAEEHFMQWIRTLHIQLAAHEVCLQLHTHSLKGHTLVKNLLKEGYEAFAKREGHTRKIFAYPPYLRLLAVRLAHKEPHTLKATSTQLKTYLEQQFPKTKVHIAPPFWHKTQKRYTQQLLLRLPHAQHNKHKTALLEWTQTQPKTLYCSFEVDF